MRKAVAGQQLLKLFVELRSGSATGATPFRFDKMDVAVPETGGQDQAIAVKHPRIFRNPDYFLIAESYYPAVLNQHDSGNDRFGRRRGIDSCSHKSQTLVFRFRLSLFRRDSGRRPRKVA